MRAFNISVLLTANSSSLRTQLHSAARDVTRYGDDVDRTTQRVGGGISRMQAGFAAAAIAVALSIGVAVGHAVKFETQLRNVNSIAHMSERQLSATGDAVLDMSRRLPQSAETLAAGLYDVASSGFLGADGLRVLEEAGVAASAGMTDTATAARGITAVLNAYGLKAEAAGQVSDVLFQTVNLGVVTFEELANTMGDFVGTTAAAGIGIAEANAALATMTLTGISAAEAGTSMNRVVQSLIKPSEELAAVFEDLGYAQGTDMIAAEGLAGTMEKLRKVTGGNINQLLALFPEIRAARGALALMSNEGRTYIKVSEQIEDSNKRLGAAKAALREQAQGLGYQWNILKNQGTAMAIEAGTALLPTLKDLVDAGGDLGERVWPFLVAAGERVAPIFADIWQAGGNVVEVLGAVVDVAGPVAGALAGLAAVAVVETLGAIAGGIEAVTGFLADNSEIVYGLAAAYAVTLLPALYATATGFAQLGLVKLVLGLEAAAVGARTFATALTGAIAAHPVLAAIAAAIAAATIAFKVGGDEVERTTAAIVAQSEAWGHSAKRADELYASVINVHQAIEGTGGMSRRMNLDVVTNFGRAGVAGERLKGVLEAVGTESPKLTRRLLDLGLASGQLKENADGSFSSIEAGRDTLVFTAADTLKLKVAEEDAAAAARRHEKDMLKVERQLGRTRGELGMTDKELEAYATRLDEAGEAARKAFASATDVVANFSLETGKKAASASTQIRKYYTDTVEEGESFAKGLAEASRRGLDPSMIQRLLEAGPKAAAPILEGILSDNSNKTLEMVNDAERKLRRINQSIVEQARLTQMAIEAPTDAMAANLGRAMDIAATKARMGGKATADAIAEELNIGVGRVNRIAAQYGIRLVDGVNPVLRGLGESEIPRPGVPRNAGGAIPGPRGADRDSVLIYGTPGEFVTRRSAVDYYGAGAMQAINDMRIPREALARNRGGFVDAGDVPGIPSFDPYQSPIRPAADKSAESIREATVAFMRRNASATNSGAQGLHPELLARFNRWDAWTQRTRGVDLGITSGWRSRAQQEILYDRYLRGQGPIAARPGTSKHERGLAIDYNPASWGLSATARRFGLTTTVPSEPWHVEMFNRGGLVGSMFNPHVRDAGGPLWPGYTYNGTGRAEHVSSHAVPARRGDSGGISVDDLRDVVRELVRETRPINLQPQLTERADPVEVAGELAWALR